MGNPTYDHCAYLKPGRMRDLAWLDQFLRALPGLAGVAIECRMFGDSDGWKPVTAWRRMQAKLKGTVRFLEQIEAINAQPAVIVHKDGVTIRFLYSDAPHVAEEAEELASDDVPALRGATARFESDGDDKDLVLEDVYTVICDALHDEGSFVLYSGQTGVWEKSPAGAYAP
jgi:hypothetical protein